MDYKYDRGYRLIGRSIANNYAWLLGPRERLTGRAKVSTLCRTAESLLRCVACSMTQQPAQQILVDYTQLNHILGRLLVVTSNIILLG